MRKEMKVVMETRPLVPAQKALEGVELTTAVIAAELLTGAEICTVAVPGVGTVGTVNCSVLGRVITLPYAGDPVQAIIACAHSLKERGLYPLSATEQLAVITASGKIGFAVVPADQLISWSNKSTASVEEAVLRQSAATAAADEEQVE